MEEKERWQKLLKIVKTWNDISFIVVAVFCVWAVFNSNFAIRWVTDDVIAATAIFNSFFFAATVAGTAAIFEAVNLSCSRSLRMGMMDTDSKDSSAMLLTYTLLMSFYLAMHAAGDALVHVDPLAFGGPRPVYTLRYLQWCLNVPLLMIVSGNDATFEGLSDTAFQHLLRPEAEQKLWESTGYSWRAWLSGVWEAPGSMMQAFKNMPLAASARLTVLYIITSWMAVVADDLFVRWVLISVSFSAYFIASLEQIALLASRRRRQDYDWSGILLVGQVALFGFYGCIYLLAVCGLMTSRQEQEAYTYSDMVAKMLHSATLVASRRSHEVQQVVQLRNFAITAAADLKRMVQEASVPIFSVDTGLQVTEWNCSIAELTGVSQDEARGRKLTELFAEGEESPWQPFAVELLAGALSDAETGLAHFHFFKREGIRDAAVVAASAKPRRDRRGDISGAVCIGQDVTELMLQRQEAQALAASLTQLIDTACVPIFEVNQDMRITEWNSWMVQMVGLNKTAVLDTHLSSLLSTRCRSTFNEAQMLSETGKPDLVEITFEASNSKQITLLMSTTPRLDLQRHVVGTIYIGQDVTKLKDIDEWKSSMMAMVSHELKSPLHGIIGLSHSLLLDETIDAQCPKKPLSMINNCAKRLLDVVTNMMDASKLVNKRDTLFTKDPVQLASIVEEVVLLCQEAVDKRGVPALKPSVKIVNALSQPLPIIEADAYRCTQLFFNLISNAVKFTHKGTVTITATADDVERFVTIDVKDTGIGIAPNCLERIFQPFDQEDRSEQRHFEGLGLGLAICREIVHRHGGNLTVSSHKGKGSTFRVMLPYRMRKPTPTSQPVVHNEDADAANGLGESPGLQQRQTSYMGDQDDGQGLTNPPEQGRLDSITSESVASIASRASFARQVSYAQKQLMGLGRLKPGSDAAKTGQLSLSIPDESELAVILSVDDDMVNQQVMASLLQSSVYKLEVATHGGEALNYLRQNPPPALVLLEVMMPGLSGPDVLRTLRKMYSAEILPVIMISSKSDKDTIARCLKLGANDFVQKPFHLSEMFARMELQCKLTNGYRQPKKMMSAPVVHHQADNIIDPALLEGLLPAELLSSLSSASLPGSTQVTQEVARSRIEEFLRKQPGETEALQSKLEVAERETVQAKDALKTLTASHESLKKGEAARLRHLQEEVRRREQRVLNFGRWRDIQKPQPPGTLVDAHILKNINRFEESLMMKELAISRIIASLPEADAEELRSNLSALRGDALRLLQENSCKDQLLLDANFRLHFLGMMLVQKDMQLGLSPDSAHIPEMNHTSGLFSAFRGEHPMQLDAAS